MTRSEKIELLREYPAGIAKERQGKWTRIEERLSARGTTEKTKISFARAMLCTVPLNEGYCLIQGHCFVHVASKLISITTNRMTKSTGLT